MAGNDTITVKIVVQAPICSTASGSYTVSDVPRGTVLIDVMELAEPLGLTFEYTTGKYGAFVTVVNGFSQHPEKSDYWIFYSSVVGKLQQGVSCYVPQDGEEITIKYEHVGASPEKKT